jgi:VanZ family protein
MRWLLSLVSSLTPTQIKVIHFYLRKTAHVMTYGVLYFLWFRAFQGHLGYSVRKSFFWSLGLSLLISALDEGHQSLFRTRGGKIEDVGLDLSAALLAAWLTAVFWQRPFRLQPASGQGAARHSGEME